MFLNRIAPAVAAIALMSAVTLAQGAKPTDPQIAHIAYTAGVLDITAAQQALKKTQNAEVRSFAEGMIKDHETVNKLALDLVAKLKVTPEDNDTSKGLTKAADAKRAELEKQFPGEENQQKRFQMLREYSDTLGPLPKVSWEKIVEHIDHAAKLVGPDHVGLGSDFDGATMPIGMEDVTQLPKLTEALVKKGYTEQQIKGILGENLLRLMEKVERAASGS